MSDLEGRLDAVLGKAVDRRRHVRHGLAGVAAVDRSWSWTGAHGVLDPDGTQATADARYPIASVTKLFTAAVTMKLVEDGRLRLDDRMVDILASETTSGLHVREGVDRTDEITVEHLLGHTSGLADYYEGAPPGGRSAQARLLAGEDAPMPFDEVLRTVRAMESHFAPQPINAATRRAKYADTNYQLLGAILEQVTGQDLAELFDGRIFQPLGLDATSSYPHPPQRGGSAEPDASVWAKDVVLNPAGALTFQKADGGIVSTVADQLRFMQALVSGDLFDDPGTFRHMGEHTNRIFFPVEYGLGVMRYAPARWMSPLFPIPAIVGHTGSTATWAFHCPDLDIVLAGAFDVAQPPLPFRFLPHMLRAAAAEL
ncbi:MAG: serine hydrolase domain-containing protein [Acidimicrobiia bacterium]